MILVTGATGKLGRPLVELLGTRARVLVRSKPVLRVANVTGDVTDPASLKGKLAGCEGVVHLAGRMTEGDPHDEALLASLRRVNVEGSLALAREAHAAGVRRFVYVSSCVVYGFTEGERVPEDAPTSAATAYAASKIEAEQALTDYCKQNGLELVIVRPALVACGKSERHDVLGEMVRLAQRGLFPLPAPARHARKALVAVSDVAEGILAAYERGRPGGVYVLAAPRAFTLEEITSTLSQLLGRRTTIPIPISMLHAAAWMCDTLLAPLGLPAPVGARRVAKLLRDQQFDVSRTMSELAFQPKIDRLEAMLEPYL